MRGDAVLGKALAVPIINGQQLLRLQAPDLDVSLVMQNTELMRLHEADPSLDPVERHVVVTIEVSVIFSQAGAANHGLICLELMLGWSAIRALLVATMTAAHRLPPTSGKCLGQSLTMKACFGR